MTKKKMSISLFCGYGLPLLFVIFCASCDFLFQPGSVNYGNGLYCWINRERSLLTVFIIPTGILMIFNLISFFICFFYLICIFVKNGVTFNHSYMFFVASKLLLGSGIQWLFGVITHLYPTNAAVRLIFVLLVSSHGILVFASTLLQRVVRRTLIQSLERVKSRIENLF